MSTVPDCPGRREVISTWSTSKESTSGSFLRSQNGFLLLSARIGTYLPPMMLRLHLRNLRHLCEICRLPLCQIGGRVSAHVDLVDIHDERVIDVVGSPRNGMSGLSGLCDCVTRSYAARPVSRQNVNKLCIDDSKLQMDDSTLQIGDSTLRIGDSTLQIGYSRPRIVDLTLLRASSNRRFEMCHSGMRV